MFIHDFTKAAGCADKAAHAFYLSHKTKVASAHNSWGSEVAIDNKWNVIRWGRHSVSMRLLRDTYGDSLRYVLLFALNCSPSTVRPQMFALN